jgi:hypothetical protein
MRPVFKFALAVLTVLALQPAFAQTPSSSTMPAGTQNPAIAQPRLVVPPQPVLSSPPPVEPQSDAPASPSSLIIPGGAGGLCECLVSQDQSETAFDRSKMHQTCLASVDACQAVCNTPHSYSFVPHAMYTCPGPPGGEPRPVAASDRRTVRLAASH